MKRVSQAQRGKRGLPRPSSQGRLDSAQRRALRLATIGEVAGVLGHESRNLLGALKSCLQLLRRNTQLTSDDLELLDIIESGSNRLHEIISDFSTFRDLPPRPLREVSLHDLLEEALASLRQDERFSADLAIERRYQAAIQRIQADPDQLRHAFWHLGLNAAQAMKGTGTLTIETQSADGSFSLRVRDTGPGFPRTSSMISIESVSTDEYPRPAPT